MGYLNSIKQEKIKDPEKLEFISNEHSILKNQLDDSNPAQWRIIFVLVELFQTALDGKN